MLAITIQVILIQVGNKQNMVKSTVIARSPALRDKLRDEAIRHSQVKTKKTDVFYFINNSVCVSY